MEIGQQKKIDASIQRWFWDLQAWIDVTKIKVTGLSGDPMSVPAYICVSSRARDPAPLPHRQPDPGGDPRGE